MIRKGTFVLLVALLACMPLAAAAFDTGVNSSDDISNGGSTSLSVKLDLATASGDDVEIGFTSGSDVESGFTSMAYKPSAISEFSLEGVGGTAKIPEGDHLYVYWKVRGTTPFTVDLCNPAALTTEATGDGETTLDWVTAENVTPSPTLNFENTEDGLVVQRDSNAYSQYVSGEAREVAQIFDASAATLSNDLTQTLFDNGVSVTVNHNDTAVKTEKNEIAAMSFIFEE